MATELTLSAQEHELLLRIVERHHHALLNEIWHTDHREFRLALCDDEKVVEAIMNRLKEARVLKANG